MTWIIIIVVLIVAFGPVLYLLPTKKDRRLAALRQHARLKGLNVELKSVKNLDPEPQQRVTAGGRLLTPEHASVAYTLSLGRRLEHVGPWRLLRGQSGWVTDTDAGVVDYLDELTPRLGSLPDDTVGVELTSRTLTCYWLERYPADAATVDSLHAALTELGGWLRARDEKIQSELYDGNS